MIRRLFTRTTATARTFRSAGDVLPGVYLLPTIYTPAPARVRPIPDDLFAPLPAIKSVRDRKGRFASALLASTYI